MTARHSFDATTMPLRGLQLIEASAGTGKTFSLAGLYLRLLLEAHLRPRDILVMTFTRAATQELRERIRTRLTDAAAVATRGATANTPEQRLAAALIEAAMEGGETRGSVARRLTEAAASMDEATITTIHGYAQRAAAEHAFDSGLPFDRGDPVDDLQLWREVIRDYWRGQTVGRGQRAAMPMLAVWPDDAALARELEPLLGKPHLRIRRPDHASVARLRDRARSCWAAESGALASMLETAVAEGVFLKTSEMGKILNATGADARELLGMLESGLFGRDSDPPLLPHWITLLGDPARLARQLPKRNPPDWFVPHTLDLCRHLARLAPLARTRALVDALEWVDSECRRRKQQRRQFSFNDVIAQLHEAVHDPDTGVALCEALFSAWPWALVDEFQDTDPLQYGVLRQIYGARRERHGGLIMIGDPKQAIYGFRGGDVFAYLQAARDADSAHTLPTNFRSTPQVLAAVEALFRQGGDSAFVIDGIGFHGVASGRVDGDRVCHRGGESVPAMTVWTLPARVDGKAWSRGAALARLQRACVDTIASMLHGPEPVTVDDADGASRTLVPGDIGILVNSNREAADLQAALASRGLAAVCLHQQRIFASEQARELLHLLHAVANPMDEDLVRAALTCELFPHTMTDLIALLADDADWRAVIEDVQQAHERWRRNGPLDMLQPWLQAAAPRLLRFTDGERRMTNWLHLAESLQTAAAETDGMAALIRWLEASMEQPSEAGGVDDEQQLRLESDDALIRISTVHRAKGLQYPVVFLPYAALMGTTGRADQPPFLYHTADGDPLASLDGGDDPAAIAQAIREQRAEAVRLLYVAVTRAEQAVVLSWGAINGAAASPLALLLHREDGADPVDWPAGRQTVPWLTADSVQRRLEQLVAAAPDVIATTTLAGEPGAPVAAAPVASPLTRPPRDDFPPPAPTWRVYSFSGLVTHASARPEPASGADDESRDLPAFDSAVLTTGLLALAGPAFGTAVHDMLESLDFGDWPLPDARDQADRRPWIHEHLRRHGVVIAEGAAGLATLDSVAQLLARTLATPLPDIGPLRGIPARRYRREMEFFLGLGGTPASMVTACLEHHGYPIQLASERREQALRGLMHGYIDLIAEADGRYWVIDYKTNRLGTAPEHYNDLTLRNAVRHGHYDLQYLIYLVALHRHLRQRLPDYDVARHLGGAQYLFVRGMTGRDAGHGVFVDQPATTLVTELDSLFRQETPR